MRLAVTFLGLDLFSFEVSTDAEVDGPGDCTTETIQSGFCLPEREGGSPELVD